MSETNVIRSKPKSRCAICGSEGTYVFKGLSDRLFGKSEGWDLKKCDNETCQLYWLDPMPTSDDIWKAYVEYYTHSEQKRGFSYNEALARKYINARYGYKSGFLQRIIGGLVYLNPLLRSEANFNVLYLDNVPGEKRVLDFGCGNGWLLDNLKSLGWETYGVDFDEKAIDYCLSKGLKVSKPEMSQFPDDYFDAITINHVIEHVHDFKKLISACYDKLKSGGQIVIATPNTDNWLLKKYRVHWMQLDPPRHLHLFNLGNLSKVLNEAGFSIDMAKSSFRIDAWATIVSREISRSGFFHYEDNSKTKIDVVVGLFYQLVTSLWLIFDKKVGGEIIIKASKR